VTRKSSLDGQVFASARVPAAHIELLSERFARVLDGRNEQVTGDVERVLGRPARDFADYARNTAATGVWSAPASA